jgi:hypothetical protein
MYFVSGSSGGYSATQGLFWSNSSLRLGPKHRRLIQGERKKVITPLNPPIKVEIKVVIETEMKLRSLAAKNISTPIRTVGRS